MATLTAITVEVGVVNDVIYSAWYSAIIISSTVAIIIIGGMSEMCKLSKSACLNSSLS